MAEFQPVPGVAEAVLSGTILGEPWANTMYFEHPTSWILTDLTQVAGNLINWWNLNMKPLSHATVILNKCVVTDLTTANGLQAVTSAAYVGNRAGDASSNNVALMVEFFTGVRGRSFKGRNFVGGSVEADKSGNNFVAAYVDDVLAAYQEIPASILVTGVDHVAVARNLDGVRLSEGIAVDVLDYRANSMIRPMKRRLPQYG